MKKFNLVISGLMIVGLMVALPVFAAQDNSNQSASMNSEGHAFNAKDLIGKTVNDRQGKELGKVEDLVFGRDGSAYFVILAHGGEFGMGGKYTPIPFQTFMSDTHNLANLKSDRGLIASLDKAKLDAAPSFKDKDWLKDIRASQDKICSYFGAGQCPRRLM